jgi:hydrogenase expression/formation protein HypC
MCLGIPGRVVSMVEGYGDQLALVDVEGVSRRVNIGLLDEGSVGPGDWVVIHMGFVLERVDEGRALQARQGLELLGRGADQQ